MMKICQMNLVRKWLRRLKGNLLSENLLVLHGGLYCRFRCEGEFNLIPVVPLKLIIK